MTRTLNPENKVRQLVLQAFRDNPGASLDELVKTVGYSKTAVYYHLSNLKNEGLITRENRPRGVYVRAAKQKETKAPKKKINKAFNAGNAFRPNAVNKTRSSEQKRIDLVVQMAKEKEAQGIIDAGVNIFFDRRVRRVLGRKAG